MLWGTAVDNLYSFRLAAPSGRCVTVRRRAHPCRKILPDDELIFDVVDEREEILRTHRLRGSDLRTPGLWKDVTNKALGGLPGIQKEGTDGVITSAEFVLHEPYPIKRTFCLEFFGPDFEEASRVIIELSRAFPNRGEETLMALEHFDDQYVRAIGYKVKAPRPQLPKAVLLIDLVGRTSEQVYRGEQRLKQLLMPFPNTCLFTAADPAEAERFWQDRKKMGAIAAHTNAFKLNEDVVLPIDQLARYAHFVEQRNVEENRENQRAFVRQALDLLERSTGQEEVDRFAEKIPQARALAEQALEKLAAADAAALRSESIVQDLRAALAELVSGYAPVEKALEKLHGVVRSRLIVLATHMHAGDGNVHVNIPVFSNDRDMMDRAMRAADDAMRQAVAMGGVVSGEHGIGVTKLKHLSRERIAELESYRRQADPSGVMNPGKLSDVSVPDFVFTPSFNLLEMEARILQHGSLEELALKIAQCVRCGRCKASCCVFYPARDMFYHPRNKNLAIGALIEALLYEAQRSHSTEFPSLKYLEDIADHCTACHKCLKPCPVNIDTGVVSVLEREILTQRRVKHSAAATRLTLQYLESRSPGFNRLFRAGVVRCGSACQRLAHRAVARLPRRVAEHLPAHDLLASSVPPVPARTLRDRLPACRDNQVLVFNPAAAPAAAVFYFPGCGSERLCADVSAACLYLLLKIGVQVVLPPPFLCCGFPAHVNARTEQHNRIVLRNTILFSQIREMFAHLSFDACVVSCGTCMEALRAMDLPGIFGSPIVDVCEFVHSRGGLKADALLRNSEKYLYHAPCHDTLDGHGVKFLASLGAAVTSVPHCCSEAGTMALSRPDISGAMLARKRQALKDGMGETDRITVLTNCPSCLQGLGRNRDLGARPRHLAEELACRVGGAHWIEECAGLLARYELTTF